jgi:hypothetical protein
MRGNSHVRFLEGLGARKGPWSTRPAAEESMSGELIAGLGGAILGAILSGIFAWWLHKAEQLRSRKEELRTAIKSIVELKEDFSFRIGTIQDPVLRGTADSYNNMKRTVYLEAAEVLAGQIGRHVSSSEYNILATELMLNSDFAQAESYYYKAIKAAKSVLSRVIALRFLASFYFGQGPRRNIDKGRQHYFAAVALLRGSKDEYSVFNLGFVYQAWGSNELGAGCAEEAANKLSCARTCYESLPDHYPLKQQALDSLNKCSVTVPVPEPVPSRVLEEITPTQTMPTSEVAIEPIRTVPANPADRADGNRKQRGSRRSSA